MRRLDVGVAGGAEDGLGASRFGDSRHMAAALHVVDDAGAGMFGGDGAGEEHEQGVGPDDLAGVGDDAQAVAVAVESEAHIGTVRHNGFDQVLQVFGLGGIRMVVGEGGIHLAVERGHFAAEGRQQLWRHQPGDAVAAIHHHFQGTGQRHIRQHPFEIARQHVGALARSLAAGW